MAGKKGKDNGPDGIQQLNVIFHGLFAYVLDDLHVNVIAPNIREHHYLAGEWMQETRLEAGISYALHGVSGAFTMPQPDRGLNAVVPGFTKIDRAPDKVFCSFCLPFPCYLYHLRVVPAPDPTNPAFFSGSDAPNPAPGSLAMIQVFNYTFKDASRVRLYPSVPWVPTTQRFSSASYTNLHIWAEPICNMDINHVIPAFETLASVFSGLDLHVDQGAKSKPDSDPTAAPGVSGYETKTLGERCPMARTSRDSGATDPRNCHGLFVNNDI